MLDGRCTGLAVARGLITGAACFTLATHPFVSHASSSSPGFFEDISGLIKHNPSQLRYGIAILDLDDDGVFEAFVTGYGKADGSPGAPNELFKYDRGAMHNVAPAFGLSAPARQAIGVAACDVDRDGREELYVLNTDTFGGDKRFGDHLFKKSTGGFTDVMELDVNTKSRSTFAGRSVACVDRRGDGKYDIAAASYGRPLLLYEMVDSMRNVVRDVAAESGFRGVTGGRGITGGPIFPGHSYTAGAKGMDVFMDNERGPSFFFRNNGRGGFEEVATELGITDAAQNGRGVALVDANADGRIDIVTGNWNGPHRMWLAPAREGGAFVDAAPPDMAEPSPIRTVLAADFDNDGYPEIFFNNICSCRHDMPSMCASPNRLFKTRDGVHWESIPVGSAEERYGRGTGAAAYDVDGDGVLELLISHGENRAEPLSLHRVADAADAKANHYLRVLPRTRSGAPARGALVTLIDGNGRKQVRVIDPGSGYLCQQEPVAHFGLGKVASVRSVTIEWPSGERVSLDAPDINMQHTVSPS